MNITKEYATTIRSRMAERFSGFTLSESEIYDLAANYDEETARAAALNRISVKRWDRESPINGVSAEDVLASREDIPEGGVVYLVCEGDRVLYFQPFRPGANGLEALTEEDWQEVAEQHRSAVAEEAVQANFSRVLLKAVNEKIKKG